MPYDDELPREDTEVEEDALIPHDGIGLGDDDDAVEDDEEDLGAFGMHLDGEDETETL